LPSAAISDAHSSLGTSTGCFYDSGSALWECNQRYLLTVGDIDKARQALVRNAAFFLNLNIPFPALLYISLRSFNFQDETLRVDIVAPVDAYLGQYRTMENRINERSRRRLEMDRFRGKVRKFLAHPPEKPEKLTQVRDSHSFNAST
jgi:hypothetical protein